MTRAELAEMTKHDPDLQERIEATGLKLVDTAKSEPAPEIKHARLSASGSGRWLNCPGSRKAEEDLAKPRNSSVFAKEGTAAHFVGELCLRNNQNAEEYTGMLVVVIDGEDERFITMEEYEKSDLFLGEDVFEVTVQFAEYVQMYLDLVRDLVAQHDGALMIEIRVDFSRWVPEGFGTADAIIIGNKSVTMVDLKFGKGVKVDAERNTQAMLYGLGVINDLGDLLDGDEEINLIICQPRLDHVSEWATTTEELLTWADEVVKPTAELAMTDNAPRVPGEKQCLFCEAKATCRELAEESAAAVYDGFEPGTTPIDKELKKMPLKHADNLTADEIGALLDDVKRIESWAAAIKDYAKAQIEAGDHIPGWKMVAGRGSRVWADVEAAERALRRKLGAAEAYKPREILSPAAAEKKLGKKDYIILNHVIKKDGAPTIAPESDKRPSIVVDHGGDFI